MLRARAATMTGVVDAITRQSVVGTDLDGVVRVWNPGAERLLGVPRAAVVRRRRITDFHDPAELGGRGLAAAAEEEAADAGAHEVLGGGVVGQLDADHEELADLRAAVQGRQGGVDQALEGRGALRHGVGRRRRRP